MLFLLFHLAEDRYALEAGSVVEVVPLLELKTIPGAPPGVAGLFNYRGQPVPALDLRELALNQPASQRLSTRIIIVNHPDADGHPHLLGLIAEQATSLMRKASSDLLDPEIRTATAPYLGPVVMDDHGIIQCVRPQHLLPDSVRDTLFADVARLSHEAS